MSFLARGDQGPANIPEGGVPINMGITNFSPGIFQAIARAGLEAAGEGSFKKTRRRGSKNRMAGQADSLSRSIERGLQSGGGEGFLPEPEPRRTTTTVYSKGRGREMPRPKGRDRYIAPRPTPMTKEEYDRMPKKARRKFELAPGMEDLIDRFPTKYDEGKPKRSRSRRSRKKFELPPGSEGVSDRFDAPPRKATRAEMEERRRNPLGIGQVAQI